MVEGPNKHPFQKVKKIKNSFGIPTEVARNAKETLYLKRTKETLFKCSRTPRYLRRPKETVVNAK